MDTKTACCILAAGKGTRLGCLTDSVNKGLLPINGKPVLSYIIEKIPSHCDIIIAIGYKGEQLVEFCSACYSDRNITFVNVDKYEGGRSGPGYSLLQCKPYIKCPFYLTTIDCIVDEDWPDLSKNWIGVSKKSNCYIYSSVLSDHSQKIIDFKNKCHDGYNDSFIGICGIRDYEVFWNELESNENLRNDIEYEFVCSFYKINNYVDGVYTRYFTWHDTGDLESYINMCKRYFSGFDFSKSDELTFIVNNKCCKWFKDAGICANRIKRNEVLKNVVPKIYYAGANVYAYDIVPGTVLSESVNEIELKKFMDWCTKKLWKTEGINFSDKSMLYDIGYRFYYEKTCDRIKSFQKNIIYTMKVIDFNIINGNEVLSIEEWMDSIDWKSICSISPCRIHGDLQLDNVICTNDGYKLIDWRQDFGGNVYVGDLYYDLSKIYAYINMPFLNIKRKLFDFYYDYKTINYSYEKHYKQSEMSDVVRCFCNSNNLDFRKVEIITSIIYMNMSALHKYPFNCIAYCKAKEILS